jgi:hypothetical protein
MQIFPFYEKEALQNRNKTWCENDVLFKHFVPFLDLSGGSGGGLYLRLPAFQFQVIADGLDSIVMREVAYPYNGYDFTAFFSNYNYYYHQAGNFTYLQYDGQVPVQFANPGTPADILQGKEWVLEITNRGVKYYSERFTTVQAIISTDFLPCGDWVYLDYTSNKNIGTLIYEQNFRQSILLPTEAGKPKYEYKEEGEEDGKGGFFQTMKRIEKTYHLEFFAPEYLTDALCTLPLHTNAVLFSNYGIFAVNDMKFEVKDWETDCIARCQISFQTDFAAARGTV